LRASRARCSARRLPLRGLFREKCIAARAARARARVRRGGDGGDAEKAERARRRDGIINVF
jgi:hypothetical protein